jgi:hypothetical protein
LFIDISDFSPYMDLPVDARFFDPQKALDPFDEKFDWKALKESPEMDDMKEMKRQAKEREEKASNRPAKSKN